MEQYILHCQYIVFKFKNNLLGSRWQSGNTRLSPLRPGFGSQYGLKRGSWKLLSVGRQSTVQNPDELYVLVSSALPTTRHDITCTVLEAT